MYILDEPCLYVYHKILDQWQRSVGNNKTDATMRDSFLKQIWMLQTDE
jgi:hypothetical protein